LLTVSQIHARPVHRSSAARSGMQGAPRGPRRRTAGWCPHNAAAARLGREERARAPRRPAGQRQRLAPASPKTAINKGIERKRRGRHEGAAPPQGAAVGWLRTRVCPLYPRGVVSCCSPSFGKQSIAGCGMGTRGVRTCAEWRKNERGRTWRREQNNQRKRIGRGGFMGSAVAGGVNPHAGRA
jgi:hypothetical protein